jgi:hypothetical protein
MKRRTFTAEEQESLRTNTHVVRCTDKTITYSDDFKRIALRAYYEEGKDARTIFSEAGFPESVVLTLIPKWTLARWRRKFGTAYEHTDVSSKRGTSGKGGRPRAERLDVSKMTDKEKITYYQTRVAYQEAENAFLAKARGLKRWPKFVWEPGKNSH